jgi:hypothetical protein
MDQDPIERLALDYLDWRNGHLGANPLGRLPDWLTCSQRDALHRHVSEIEHLLSVVRTIRGDPAGPARETPQIDH